VRVYTPRGGAESRPGVLYIDGGGFCFGSIEYEHQGTLEVAHRAQTVVVSVGYRRHRGLLRRPARARG
jgi:acetyl esterase/lipase